MTSNWPKIILNNFGEAAPHYNAEAELQSTFAWRLAKECSKESIPQGIWVDLGAGTGLLAEALEALNPNKSVIRVDGSPQMLAQNRSTSQTQLCDLNIGLPTWPHKPALLASNFALHWLNQPANRIAEWFTALTPGGWLAIALPVHGSFEEWHVASRNSGVRCTALHLPSTEALLQGLSMKNVRYQELQSFTQTASKVSSLLKPMINIGAHSTPKLGLSVGDWRRLQRSWPYCTENGAVRLTWLIQLLLVQR
ncbi:methyltransferase domain-containing protein [Prochlorococcus sp. MIT 1307]|uniref:methyltransferase domain-containing protein n=1 Tax=Prochlorococcus sp. MIT 1307 TaxID=3096219 RepID=UPI002A754067|nr:methyltransferase domain-containing protein [Prochlorococcus sp. MIT 1307]